MNHVFKDGASVHIYLAEGKDMGNIGVVATDFTSRHGFLHCYIARGRLLRDISSNLRTSH